MQLDEFIKIYCLDKRCTPEHITHLNDREIFVFGSNTSGRHGKGAAKTAMKWGAVYGNGEGQYGKTYALPTVNKNITASLDIDIIGRHVKKFITHAAKNTEFIYLVTAIGCGLAHYKVKDIAPLFADVIDIPNIYLPLSFWKHIHSIMYPEV